MTAPLILTESRPQRTDRRAFTLTELSIVLGVIGLILGSIWVAAGQAYDAQKATKAANQIQQIFTGYRSLYGKRRVDAPNLSDITSIGINAGYFPSDMISGATVNNPWGGTVTVYADATNNGASIFYFNLPTTACIALATAEANAPNLIWSGVGSWAQPNGIAYPPFGTGADGNGGRMTSTQINAFCSASNNNFVNLDFSMN